MVPFFMATSWGAFSCGLSGDACGEGGDEGTGAEEVGRSPKNSPTEPTRRIGMRIKALRTGYSSRIFLAAHIIIGYISGYRLIRTSQRGGRNPARVTVTSRRTAALDGRLLAA